MLSANGKVSCASCHRQAQAFSDSPNRLSVGVRDSTLRNSPGLFNLAWGTRFFWDGKETRLQDQIFHPVRNQTEMGAPWAMAVERIEGRPDYAKSFRKAFSKWNIDSTMVVDAIAHFLLTIRSADSKFDRTLRGETTLNDTEYRGFVLMNDMTKGDCLHCHTTDANALGTTGLMSNNGLDGPEAEHFADPGLFSVTGRASDMGKFKIPSLRNLSFTGPYMHDGRFETLDEVLEFYAHGVNPGPYVDSKMSFAAKGGNRLSCEEQADIIAFLLTLNDSTLLTRSEFADPGRP